MKKVIVAIAIVIVTIVLVVYSIGVFGNYMYERERQRNYHTIEIAGHEFEDVFIPPGDIFIVDPWTMYYDFKAIPGIGDQ